MTGKKMSPARRAVLERRAAAARRRATLTFVLFLVTVVVSVVAFNTALSAWFIAIPAGLTASVLVLGRRAVVANERADAAYEARRNKVSYAPRQMSETERRLSGRPVPAVRTGIPTAQAENISTTVLSRVESSMFAKKHMTGRPVSDSLASQASHTDKPVNAQAAETARTSAAPAQKTSVPVPAAPTSAPAAASQAVPAQATPAQATPTQATAHAAKTWTARPVPQPTYTAKAAAPRWEAPGITAELQQITKERMAAIAQEAAVQAKNNPAPQLPVPTQDSTLESVTTQDSDNAFDANGGFSLNSILERRRAV